MSTHALPERRRFQGTFRFLFMNIGELAQLAWEGLGRGNERAKQASGPQQELALQPPPEIWLPRSCSSHLER